jgi:hypothetical protein
VKAAVHRDWVDIPVPLDGYPLGVALAVVEHLVQTYGAEVMDVDLDRDAMGTFTLRISTPAGSSEPRV